jgi:hypothetical protein
MTEAFEQDYETAKQKTLYASWIKLKLSCDNKGIAPPSYKTFAIAACRRVGAHVKVNKFEQRPVWGRLLIIAAGGIGFHIIAA